MKTIYGLVTFVLTLSLVITTGCTGGEATVPVTDAPPDTTDTHDDHAHPTEGPHHGELIELGNEEYHAEILHDEDAGTITIYVLDSHATQAVPIEATEITINAKHDGQPEQFTLAASPDEGDPEGKSSRFTSSDADLAHHLHDEEAEPKLVLTIDGKSYRGSIKHDDHGHDHHDH